MRIGIDARMYSSAFTGIGRYVHELIDHVLKYDPENEYVLFFNEPYFSQFKIPRGGVEKICVNAKHYSTREQTVFLKKLLDAKLDLMHFTHFNAPILYRRPSVVTIHDLTLSFFPGQKMTSFLHRTAYHFTISSIIRRAKKIIAVSQNTKEDIKKLFGASEDTIKVIYLGVNKEFRFIEKPEPRRRAVTPPFSMNRRAALKRHKRMRPEPRAVDSDFILYTGNWRSHKNLVNLIRAFAMVKKKYASPLELVITGKEDPWYPEVKEAVRKDGLSKYVKFVGLVSDQELIELYNAAEIFVYPSLYEGFGLPALEAFACHTPVCASYASSIPEICGNAALYFDPHKVTDVAARILELLENPGKKAELVRNGLEQLKLFSWEKMARETLEIYTSAIL